MMALSRVVFTSREHVIGLEPRGKGIMGITLRYPYEVRDENDYFGDIPSEQVTKDMLDLAKHIIKTKTGHFKPNEFEDQYEDALKDLLRKKDKGEKIEAPREPRSDNVVNLMDALRAERTGRTRARKSLAQTTRQPAPEARKKTGSLTSQKSKLDVCYKIHPADALPRCLLLAASPGRSSARRHTLVTLRALLSSLSALAE
jgi:Uncharacterized conserved protein